MKTLFFRIRYARGSLPKINYVIHNLQINFFGWLGGNQKLHFLEYKITMNLKNLLFYPLNLKNLEQFLFLG